MIPPAVRLPPYAPVARQPNDNVIVWNGRFLDLRPQWYDSLYYSQLFGGVSGGASFFSGGLAVASYFYMKGKPQVVINSVRGLGVATLIAGLASLYLYHRRCWQDPEYRIEQGKIAAEDIVKNRLSIKEIGEKYGHYRNYGLLTPDDLNRLLRNLIADESVSFKDAIDRVKGDVALDETNLELMKRKLLHYLQNGDVHQISEEELRFLGLNLNDLDIYICFPALKQLEENEIPFGKFLQRVDVVRWRVYTQDNLDAIKGFAIAYYVRENLGTQAILQRPEARFLNISLQMLAEAGAFENDLAKLKAGQISYRLYRERHTAESYPFLNPDNFDAVKQAYFISYKVMREFPDDAALFGADSAQALQAQFEKEIKEITTIQELIEKLGVTVFTDKRLTKDDSRLKRWVISSLATYHVPPESPLRKYDLMSAAVSDAVSVSMQRENELLQSVKGDKERIQKAGRSEKERVRKDIEARKKALEPLEELLKTTQQIIERLETEKKKLENQIQDNLSIVGKSYAASQELRKSAQEAGKIQNLESAEVLTLRQKMTTTAIEECKRIKTQLENHKQLPANQEKLAELERGIKQKETDIQALNSQDVSGYSEASEALRKADKLEKEKKALVFQKEELAKKIEGVIILADWEIKAGEEKLKQLAGLEAELVRLNSALKERERADKLKELQKKTQEELRRMPTQSEIEHNLNEFYGSKVRVEQELALENLKIEQYKKQSREAHAALDQSLKTALKEIEDRHNPQLQAADERLARGKREIQANFEKLLAAAQ